GGADCAFRPAVAADVRVYRLSAHRPRAVILKGLNLTLRLRPVLYVDRLKGLNFLILSFLSLFSGFGVGQRPFPPTRISAAAEVQLLLLGPQSKVCLGAFE